MLYKRVGWALVGVLPHSPHIVCGRCRYSIEIAIVVDIRAWHYRPRCAIPMLCQRMVYTTIGARPHSPHVVCGHCRYSTETTHIGAWDHRPRCAIPMYDTTIHSPY